VVFRAVAGTNQARICFEANASKGPGDLRVLSPVCRNRNAPSIAAAITSRIAIAQIRVVLRITAIAFSP
jgi:hypothetical protein